MVTGDWLSGLTDGEGCFYLLSRERQTRTKVTCEAQFQIALREDDIDLLHQIQTYFSCGSVNFHVRHKTRGKENPVAHFIVNRLHELVGNIIPHFRKYPLHSKKKRDFEIWSRAVELMWHVYCSVDDRVIPRRRGSVRASTWKQEEIDEFIELVVLLKTTREYKTAEQRRGEGKT